MTTPGVDAAGRREWTGLAVLALPTMLLSLDISVLFLALPHLSAGLGADSTAQLWISDIYGFMTAAFMVTMGTLGDRVGRRKVMMIGAAAFCGASVMAALSVNAAMLIAARGLTGIAGAMLLPSILALIGAMFPNPRQRAAALAVWMTFFMGGIALGPAIGGVLLDNFWWGSVFLMGVPVMLVLLVAGPLLLPESRSPEAGNAELISVVLSLATILPVIYGLKKLAENGWSPLSAVAVVAGAACGVLFVLRQRRLTAPLLDMRLFQSRAFSGALAIGLLVGAVQSGTALLVAQHLQMVDGLSAARAGMWLAIPALSLIVGINLASAVARRVRPGYVLAAGMVISLAGQLVLIGAGGVAVVITGVSIIYFGAGAAAALINVLVLAVAPPEQAGAAEAASGTSGELGVALGIALLGSVAAAVYHGRLTVPAGVPAVTARTASQSIAGAESAAGHLPARLGTELIASARAAFTAGLSVSAVVSAAIFFGIAALAVVLLRHVQPIGAPEPERPEAAAEAPDRREVGSTL
jgi:DHA2 family multidrug resistance protein-like MFS transporter